MFQPFLYLSSIRQIIKTNKITDLIGFSDIGAYLVFFSFFFNRTVRKFVWLHNSYYQPINPIIKFTRLWVYKQFYKVIVLNKKDESIYFEKLGVEKAVRIPNPISFELDRISSLSNKKIISIGRLHKEKGFPFLIEAMKIVHEKHPNWKLDIIGQDRGEKHNLKQMILKYGLGECVSILPPTRDIHRVYLNSSIYVMTSHFECLPLVLTEAREAGLPLIAYDSPSGISDLVVNNSNGYLIERFNVQLLAQKINELIESKELRIQFGTVGKKLNLQLKMPIIIKKWEQILK
ncbi:MAG: glycosyltransferase [Labilibaculum sp.]|nr:glycosyltransferase [Labilibaculum sp.]